MAGIWPQMESLLWFLLSYEVYKTKANFIVQSYVKEKYKKSHNEVYSVQYVIKWHNTLQSLYHDRNLVEYHMNHCRYV